MKRLILASSITAFIMAVSASLAAQCLSCGLDNSAGCLGYYASLAPSRCGPPPPPPNCECGGSPLSISFLDSLNPGLAIAVRSGRVYISEILHGSKAAADGILPNDEIISINGKSVAAVDPDATWESANLPGFSSLIIRRNNLAMKKEVRLVSVKYLLENEWRSGPGLVLASAQAKPEEASIGGIDAPFTTGVRAHLYQGRLFVSAVLRNSPADRAGLNPGDEIVLIDGVDPVRMTLSALRAGFTSFAVRTTSLTIRHNQTAKTVALRMQGASQIMNHLGAAELDQYPFL